MYLNLAKYLFLPSEVFAVLYNKASKQADKASKSITLKQQNKKGSGNCWQNYGFDCEIGRLAPYLEDICGLYISFLNSKAPHFCIYRSFCYLPISGDIKKSLVYLHVASLHEFFSFLHKFLSVCSSAGQRRCSSRNVQWRTWLSLLRTALLQ